MMMDNLAKQIQEIARTFHHLPVSQKFLDRLAEGHGLTRDKYVPSHFCVYFAAYDPQAGQVFVGHHKKSGLWLFNGGHIDRGETAGEALQREIGEEWGLEIDPQAIGEPRLLTITEIDKPSRVPCDRHYDIWYFVPVRKEDFHPDQNLLAAEYHEIGWLTFAQARLRTTDPNTLEAISVIEADFAGP